MSENFESSSSDIDEITLYKGYIYEISNPFTNKIYVGSSFYPSARFSKHKNDFKKYKQDGNLISSSSLVFDASEDISTTKMNILEIVWISNRKELERIEATYILDNRDFCVNKRHMKSKEEMKREFNLHMRQRMKLKYDSIPYITCSLCGTRIKESRVDDHKSTKMCNRRSESWLYNL